MGLLCGWIFRGLARIDKTKIVSYVVAGLSGALLNTIFFMSSLILLFGRTLNSSFSYVPDECREGNRWIGDSGILASGTPYIVR